MAIGRVPGETGIQPSIVTAKGDLIVATANGSVTNQAVGTNNQVLMADSAQGDGVKWANEATSTLTTTGDILYASAANTLARRAIGSTGDVLTVSGGLPTWATPAGSNANWSLLNAGGTSLSGATTITVSGISAKNAIMVLVDAASTTSAGNSTISVRLNADTGSNYFNVGSRLLNGSTYSASGLSPIDALETGIIIGRMGDSSSSIVSAYVLLNGCNSSGVKIFNCAGTGSSAGGSGQYGVNFGGYYSGSSTISSVSVFSSDGNFDAGLVYVYTTA